MTTLQPFTKRSFKSVAVINRLKTYTPYRHKVRVKAYFDFASIINIWRGASEIVYKFFFSNVEAGVLLVAQKSISSFFCPCITWVTGPETLVRYKLWDNVGEILYVPLYAGQIIPNTFNIEIWNTPVSSGIISNGELYVSKIILPGQCALNETSRIPSSSDATGILDEFGRIILDEGGNTLQPE